MCSICKRIEAIKYGDNPHFVKELETGYVVIGDEQHFEGYTLFLCKLHRGEIFELESEFQRKHFEELVIVTEAVSRAFHAQKMNVESLGNSTPHLHWHIFPRRRGDLMGYGSGRDIGPVWWLPREKMYDDANVPDDAKREELKQRLAEMLDTVMAKKI